MSKSQASSPLKPAIHTPVGSPRGSLPDNVGYNTKPIATAYPVVTVPHAMDSLKLLIGVGGIYTAFLYYGSLQEDVFDYTSITGEKFKNAWFLQFIGKMIIQ